MQAHDGVPNVLIGRDQRQPRAGDIHEPFDRWRRDVRQPPDKLGAIRFAGDPHEIRDQLRGIICDAGGALKSGSGPRQRSRRQR